MLGGHIIAVVVHQGRSVRAAGDAEGEIDVRPPVLAICRGGTGQSDTADARVCARALHDRHANPVSLCRGEHHPVLSGVGRRFADTMPELSPAMLKPPAKRACSTFMQRSATTSIPASSARRIASGLTTPYWNQMAGILSAIASSTNGMSKSGRRNTSTMSGIPRAATRSLRLAYAGSPSIDWWPGFIGYTVSPLPRR